ncbi:uncharacterized protein Z518_09668 [Rhinocladiella mackenziei CBS 650.93]|uniref:Uncharacterized protein n=1 Tax=Rhinocladiella mackenziei CBS 650.93 TaxID=1442369 RepID=A0A0D2GQN6_9EURO|nr:uncharacterized protein Z518_09668 [Rhinocladiella mackenziei CBS 650.93]KIX00603.1 hypothetical protein Z518_09668 [Rhinocladiella mackenziei CBS 650.93]
MAITLQLPQLQVEESLHGQQADAITLSPRSRNSSANNPFLNIPSTPALSSSASSVVEIDPAEALRPDPGTEAGFHVENNPFAFTPGHLNKLLNPKSLQAFVALGGLRGIERGLRTDIEAGLSIEETSLPGQVKFDDVALCLEKAPDNDSSAPPKPNHN